MVATIIVTFNATRNNWLNKCLESLLNSSLPTTIFVVDNDSQDETVETIKKDFPNVKLIESKKNLGFAKANNIGIKKALDEGFEFFFLLNQDAWIKNDTLSELVRLSDENLSYGIISPIHLNGRGDKLDLNFSNYITRRNLELPLFLKKLIYNENDSSIFETQFINAAAWLIPLRTINTVGLFDDEMFTHYGEDENYVHRVHFHGLKVGFTLNSFVFHDRESRNGKKQNTVFDSGKSLLRFKINHLNPNNSNTIKSIQVSSLESFFNGIKSLFVFKFQNSLNDFTIALKKWKMKNAIIQKKNTY